MFATGLIARGVLGYPVGVDVDLTGDEPEHGVRQRLSGDPSASGIAKEAELDRETQTVRSATTFGDQIQVRRGERVALGNLPGIGGQHQELSVLSGREDFLSG